MNLLVNIDVDDLEKATRFYTSAFGLRVGRRFGSFGVDMLGSSAPIYLLVKAPGSPPSPATTQIRNYSRHWTPVHLDFVVEPIEPAVHFQCRPITQSSGVPNSGAAAGFPPRPRFHWRTPSALAKPGAPPSPAHRFIPFVFQVT